MKGRYFIWCIVSLVAVISFVNLFMLDMSQSSSTYSARQILQGTDTSFDNVFIVNKHLVEEAVLRMNNAVVSLKTLSKNLIETQVSSKGPVSLANAFVWIDTQEKIVKPRGNSNLKHLLIQ